MPTVTGKRGTMPAPTVTGESVTVGILVKL